MASNKQQHRCQSSSLTASLIILVLILLTSTITLSVLYAKEYRKIEIENNIKQPLLKGSNNYHNSATTSISSASSIDEYDENDDENEDTPTQQQQGELPPRIESTTGGNNNNNGTTLLLIDVQNCFHSNGELPIATADEDSDRIAEMILNNLDGIDRIIMTQDSHYKNHIAHPNFWIDSDGQNHPSPFTPISHSDILEGKWKPNPEIQVRVTDDWIQPNYFGTSDYLNVLSTDDSSSETINVQRYVEEYTKRLESSGQFGLFIWPEHCLMGTPGHNIYEPIRQAVLQWSERTGRSPEFVMKGQNLLTEFYSFVEAEVPINEATSFNMDFVQDLYNENSRILIGGQAKSHCVNFSIRDILSVWPTEETYKINLLVDGSSPVPGFETSAEELESFMQHMGANLITVDEAF